MRKGAVFCIGAFMLVMLSIPCFGAEKTYRIETLQVTAIEPFNLSYNNFIKELAKNGIVQGKNLTVNRTIIDFDVEKAGLWKKIGVLLRIKSEASRIVKAKPDLVLTIGTPATKYAKDKITAAGIPLVFTAVAIPTAAGCKSMTESGPGFTGSTLYMSMRDTIKILKLAFPKMTTIGMIHSDDDNAVAQAEEAKKNGSSLGVTFLTKQVGKSEHISPYAKEFINQGVHAFAVPLDTYYALRNNEAARELIELRKANPNILVVSFVNMKIPGAILYVGSDFGYIGMLSGQQAVKILKDGVKPETLPVLKQPDLNVMVDLKVMKESKIQLPMELLQLAKPVE
jgi:putative tryptophan/tyrosine transport system substrate-binding protein